MLHVINLIVMSNILGQYLELSEDKNTERYQQLLADFEKRKKVINDDLNCMSTSLLFHLVFQLLYLIF